MSPHGPGLFPDDQAILAQRLCGEREKTAQQTAGFITYRPGSRCTDISTRQGPSLAGSSIVRYGLFGVGRLLWCSR
ncbi:hypothetical protein [Streptomyces sp. 35G-GA-8]|uniref:hypothetical protein n=1 Tax=Streptomyces sp. 35G-GA-8 TaxID=2939434 RepID=UPI00201F8632|nr:hypothetical protein [Streptomyces sp. 35G-GA-8]MCL7381302.1 hypothetical protein [Streptomyces sp. 35G-GA-8]